MICVLCKDPTVSEIMDQLLAHCYYGESVSLISELDFRLPRSRPIFKNDNEAVYMKIEKVTSETAVESTIKCVSHHKCGRGAFQDLISDHNSEANYRVISKKGFTLLQTIK